MAEQIGKPPKLEGNEREQIRQIWDYLYRTAELLNIRLEGIGSNDLTDRERETMRPILSGNRAGPSEMITLKNMIVKTAEYIQKRR